MPISFSEIRDGAEYSRQTLAKLWGYASFHAIARGVVTPKQDNKIVLFVTQEKQPSSEQYEDYLSGGSLVWEGPKDHFAQNRILKAESTGEEIHLFYREKHHSDFLYRGRLKVVNHVLHIDKSSRFIFDIV